MKPIGILSSVFLATVLLALPAFAQDKPAPQPEAAKPEPMKEAVKPAPTKSAASRKAGRRWNEDARHCLEKGSNTEVIKCAEEYL
jgi:hypothetical protein